MLRRQLASWRTAFTLYSSLFQYRISSGPNKLGSRSWVLRTARTDEPSRRRQSGADQRTLIRAECRIAPKGCKLTDYNREIRIEIMLCAEMQSSCVTSRLTPFVSKLEASRHRTHKQSAAFSCQLCTCYYGTVAWPHPAHLHYVSRRLSAEALVDIEANVFVIAHVDSPEKDASWRRST